MSPPSVPAGAALVAVCADDVHFHFARRVAAQTRTVLHEHDLRAVRGGDRRADAGQAAPRDEEVGLQLHERHVRFAREPPGFWPLGAISQRRV